MNLPVDLQIGLLSKGLPYRLPRGQIGEVIKVLSELVNRKNDWYLIGEFPTYQGANALRSRTRTHLKKLGRDDQFEWRAFQTWDPQGSELYAKYVGERT
jgi:hypothetical protein